MTENDQPADPQTPPVPSNEEAPGVEPPVVEAPVEDAPVVATSTPAPEPAPAPAEPVEPPGEGWGTGRRKSAVARVFLKPGTGKLLINKREVDDYFTEENDRKQVLTAFEVCDQVEKWDTRINVGGGGHTGQAGAIRLGIARALIKCSRPLEASIRAAGYLTCDARRVERKKYGQRGARRRFQFSKR